jgi:hypothetical protein
MVFNDFSVIRVMFGDSALMIGIVLGEGQVPWPM